MSYKITFLDGVAKEFDSLSGADLREADLRGANLREADLKRADLSGADLRGANLRGADLGYADLSYANLGRADLSCANLNGADLSYVSLSGVDLYNTSVITFQLGKHFGFYHEGYLKIGCKGHSLEYWIYHVETIGKQHNYTPQEIARYKFIINNIGSLA